MWKIPPQQQEVSSGLTLRLQQLLQKIQLYIHTGHSYKECSAHLVHFNKRSYLMQSVQCPVEVVLLVQYWTHTVLAEEVLLRRGGSKHGVVEQGALIEV